jgi:hypothetical protein
LGPLDHQIFFWIDQVYLTAKFNKYDVVTGKNLKLLTFYIEYFKFHFLKYELSIPEAPLISPLVGPNDMLQSVLRPPKITTAVRQ